MIFAHAQKSDVLLIFHSLVGISELFIAPLVSISTETEK